jgi:Reverse transcriptase (RNA-dependent DNA polymerase)
MDKEMECLNNHLAWEIVERGEHNVLPTRWVLSTKHSPLETKKKARFIIRGLSQLSARDYKDTFAPKLCKDCMRLPILILARRKKKTAQIDIQSAILRGKIDKPTVAEPPEVMFLLENRKHMVHNR